MQNRNIEKNFSTCDIGVRGSNKNGFSGVVFYSKSKQKELK